MIVEFPKLDPAKHAIGHRLMCRESWVRSILFEIVLIEWSPGGRAKVEYIESGSKSWIDTHDLPEVVEDLSVTTHPQRGAK